MNLLGPSRREQRIRIISLALLLGLLPAVWAGEQTASRFEILSRQPSVAADAELSLEAFDDADTTRSLALRVVITASDGSHPDGSGRGVYSDGRFFADGKFSVHLPVGKTKIRLQSGPDYLPLEIPLETKPAEKIAMRAFLHCWFSPRKHGWFGGDNHVHTQHDVVAETKTDFEYTAVQARANGLSFITEAGGIKMSPAEQQRLSRPDFLMTQGFELKRSCFAGHLNTPGIREPLSASRFDEILRHPLPVQGITTAIHELGGVTIHSHPLAPAYQLHWMGATEIYSDAVMGRCTDALDTDSPATELLRFAVLNLGNRQAVSSYTDCALDRQRTLSPGDRRVYCRADALDRASIAEAFRRGHTFATDGGPVFVFFTIDGKLPGDSIRFENEQTSTARIEVHHSQPLKKVELYRRGNCVKAFDLKPGSSESVLTHSICERENGWYSVRAEDADGHWAVTSPIYIEPRQAPARPPASALLLEISNIARFNALRHEFFAHVLATVSPDQQLTEVQLLKDGAVLQSFKSTDGNRLPADGQIPVNGRDGDYAAGSIWFPESSRPEHFQADHPVSATGWYAIRALTATGRKLESDAVFFDSANPNSHELSVVNLSGADTRFVLWGYAEDMPLAQIKSRSDGNWFYPKNSFWKIAAQFATEPHELAAGNRTLIRLFRKAD